MESPESSCLSSLPATGFVVVIVGLGCLSATSRIAHTGRVRATHGEVEPLRMPMSVKIRSEEQIVLGRSSLQSRKAFKAFQEYSSFTTIDTTTRVRRAMTRGR